MTCTGPAHIYANIGSYTVTMTVTDKDNGAGSNTALHIVIFDFKGFFAPIDNLPALNLVKAGSSVPIKFSLTGNAGLNIFAAGYPKSVRIACDASAEVDPVEHYRYCRCQRLEIRRCLRSVSLCLENRKRLGKYLPPVDCCTGGRHAAHGELQVQVRFYRIRFWLPENGSQIYFKSVDQSNPQGFG